MSKPLQRVTIDGREYEFAHHPGTEEYTFLVEGKRCRFKRWTWGEKNRITNECVAFNPTTNRFEVNTIAFNEKMLTHTMKELESDGQKTKPTLDTVRGFNAALGDQLLMIAQWVNAIDTNSDEKTSVKLSKVPGDDSTYDLNINNDVFKLGMWSWGEKNRVTDQSVQFDPDSGQLKMDLQRFNESLLLATVKQAHIAGKPVTVDANFLGNLDAAAGDILLQSAQEINEITEQEKKN
ncbi:MAG: hypothetical protein PVH61_20130 [Candidatus Aminicenantes bacterium]|jgi:hypothetical protein